MGVQAAMLIALKTFKMRSYSKDQRTDVSKELELERNNQPDQKGESKIWAHVGRNTNSLLI